MSDEKSKANNQGKESGDSGHNMWSRIHKFFREEIYANVPFVEEEQRRGQAYVVEDDENDVFVNEETDQIPSQQGRRQINSSDNSHMSVDKEDNSNVEQISRRIDSSDSDSTYVPPGSDELEDHSNEYGDYKPQPAIEIKDLPAALERINELEEQLKNLTCACRRILERLLKLPQSIRSTKNLANV